MPNQPRVFLAFAPSDQGLRDKLVTQLDALPRDLVPTIVDKRSVRPGANKESSIAKCLSDAHVVVLLLSADFLASTLFTRHVDLFLRSQSEGPPRIYPLLLRSCGWKEHDWLKRMSIRPEADKPLDRTRSKRDLLLSEMAKEIADAARERRDYQLLTDGIEAQGRAIQSLDEKIQRYDLKLRKQQVRDAAAQSSCIMNATITASLLPLSRGAEGGTGWILETRLGVKNCGHQSWCLPAVYVAIRAPVDTTELTLETRHHGTAPEMFPLCEGLGGYRNLARLARSMHHIEPNEEISFFRWDIVDREFLMRYPVVLVHAETLAMQVSLVGTGYSLKLKKGPFRDKWLTFMEEDGGRRHGYMILGRANGDEVGPRGERLSYGSRILLLEDGTPDFAGSAAFRELLDSTYRYVHAQTVSLCVALDRGVRTPVLAPEAG